MFFFSLFCRQYNFDGLDLDWEYPTFRDGGKPEDRYDYAKFVVENRETFELEVSFFLAFNSNVSHILPKNLAKLS